MSLRIGQGIDVHRFGEAKNDEHIILGGVKIPSEKPILAHSDGDILLHALCDALLGALALGDIGKHFPDTDKEFSNIDSRVLLKNVFRKIEENGYKVVNTDLSIAAQKPKMAPFIDAMRDNISQDLNTPLDTVSVKATTTEKLGFVGRSEGIFCSAVVLLEKV